jgi:hypothetical protein
MVRDTLNVKFLEHCEPGELVRIDLGAQVQWGIVARRQQKRNVVVISGESAPWCLDPRDAVLLCLTYGESRQTCHLRPSNRCAQSLEISSVRPYLNQL